MSNRLEIPAVQRLDDEIKEASGELKGDSGNVMLIERNGSLS